MVKINITGNASALENDAYSVFLGKTFFSNICIVSFTRRGSGGSPPGNFLFLKSRMVHFLPYWQGQKYFWVNSVGCCHLGGCVWYR